MRYRWTFLLLQGPGSDVKARSRICTSLRAGRACREEVLNHGRDGILRLFAAQVVASLHRDDSMTRLGGDEFVVILKGHAPEQTPGFAESILKHLAALPVAGAGGIGASVGIADLDLHDTLETVPARADAALYRAKAAGKGMARVFASGSNATRLASIR